MAWQESLLLLLGGTTLLLFMGLPVAYSFFGINIIGAILFFGGEAGLLQLTRNGVVSVTYFSLTPIPLFLLMGEILFHTELAHKAIDAVERVIPRMPGRLAIITVVAGTIFSAISGSTIATTAMLGSLMLPMMLARGYHPSLGMGPIMAIGGVDMLIPPSALTVLLGSLSGISISKLLLAGVVPGLILSAVFIGYIMISVSLNPSLAPASEEVKTYSGWERWRPIIQYVLPLSSIFIAVVGLMSKGVATPTESAALGAMATVLLAMGYRVLTFAKLWKSLTGAVVVSGMILFIIVGATTFSQVLSFSGATSGVVDLMSGSGISAASAVLIMMAVLIFLGLFVDQVSTMLLTLPFFMPVVQRLHIDDVWFGVLFLVCMQIGLLLPPHGLLLYTMKSVAPKHITMGDIFRAVMPYVIFSLLLLAAIYFFPPITTWLPRLLMGK